MPMAGSASFERVEIGLDQPQVEKEREPEQRQAEMKHAGVDRAAGQDQAGETEDRQQRGDDDGAHVSLLSDEGEGGSSNRTRRAAPSRSSYCPDRSAQANAASPIRPSNKAAGIRAPM